MYFDSRVWPCLLTRSTNLIGIEADVVMIKQSRRRVCDEDPTTRARRRRRPGKRLNVWCAVPGASGVYGATALEESR